MGDGDRRDIECGDRRNMGGGVRRDTGGGDRRDIGDRRNMGGGERLGAYGSYLKRKLYYIISPPPKKKTIETLTCRGDTSTYRSVGSAHNIWRKNKISLFIGTIVVDPGPWIRNIFLVPEFLFRSRIERKK